MSSNFKIGGICIADITALSAICCKKNQHNITKLDTFIGAKKEQMT